MCIDRFTRWFTATPLPRHDVHTVISGFLRDWVANYGAPLKCVTDQVKIFLSQAWQQVISFLGTSHAICSPYHPQASAQTESFNLTLNNALKSQLHTENWAHRLPMVLLALRALHREEFDASSAMTPHGMNLRLPFQFYPRANEWQTDPQAALHRHEKRVASYQYVPTRFPAHQKVHVNKRLLTCSHVMMSNEHRKHSLDAPRTCSSATFLTLLSFLPFVQPRNTWPTALPSFLVCVGTEVVGYCRDPYWLRGQPSCCRSTGQSPN